MSDEKKDEYNGWKNYETWCVKLWLDNDEYHQNLMLTMAEDAVRETKGDEVWKAKHALAIALQDEINGWYYDMCDNIDPNFSGMFQDLLGNAIARVDFDEISENVLEDMDE